MSKELVIGSNRHETKVAILEEDQLTEVYFQRANEYSLAGSIHKGRVTRVLPGMQSAFVDLGLERDTFLYVSDFFEENEDIDAVTDEKPVRSDRPSGGGNRDRSRDRDRDRDGERGTSQARPFERTLVTPVRTELQAGSTPEDARQAGAELSAPAAVHAPESLNAPVSENRQADGRPTADRGNFRGDRRGRRSRRRRSRPDGFPENKYAHPNAQTSAPQEGAEEPVRHIETVASEAVEEADVIVLPGESLAKYRNRGSSSAEHIPPVYTEASDSPHVLANEPDELAGTFEESEAAGQLDAAELDAAEQAEIEAEAASLELTDRILSHRSGFDAAEEEKLAAVRADQPTSPFVVGDIEEEYEPADDSASFAPVAEMLIPSISEPEEHGASIAVSLPDLPSRSVSDASGETLHPEPPSRVPDSEIAFADLDAAAADFSESDEDAAEAALLELEAASGSGAEGVVEGNAVQTATVRDEGGRSMHRVSRRMRRRRGGNRGGQNLPGQGPVLQAQGLASTAAPLEVGFEARSATQPSGTAAALQPESRAESRRESDEEHQGDRPERVYPSISELLKPGQEIIVQIAKEPLGQKGARITSHIALPGRYVVFMPSVNHVGVSRKIASDEERQRLKRILQTHREGTTGGFIVRTAGEGIPEEEIAADMDFLYKLWLDIRQKAEKKPAPALLHYDLDVVQRILRDQVTEDFKAIWVDNEEMYESVLSFMQRFQPALVNRVKMYTRSAPIYDAFGITQELEKALRPKVWLNSGGYIVINQTEALVAIDINTGKYVGKSNRLEDTIVKTNTEAVKEIVRQIRLRDLGGIIVVDFIDMDERKNRQKVMQALEEAMQADRAPYKILQFNDFGLVAITRKRVKQSLERTLCSPCPYCEGAGYVKSVQTVIGEILVEAQKLAKAVEGKDVLLRVHPAVAKVLKGNDNKFLEELEEILRRPVLVKSDPALHAEKFDLG